MKICILTSSYPSHPQNDLSGAFARHFAIELLKQNHQVTIITQQTTTNFVSDKNINVIRFLWTGKSQQASTIKPYSLKGLINTFSLIKNGTKALNNLLTNENFDIILALWTVPAGLWCLLSSKRKKTPYAIWSLGSDIWVYGRNPLTKWLIKLIIKKSNLIFADGIGLCQEIKKISGKKCFFMPTTRTLPKPIKSKINFSKDKINFIFIGRYHKTKGPDVLIKAISLLPKNISKKTFFHFFGTGEMKDQLKNDLTRFKIKNAKINNTINSQEVANFMEQADFLIIPSRFDSIPVVFSEALQSNLPMVVTDVGDTGNLVKKYNIGYVCEKENPKSLAKIISKATTVDKNIFKKNIHNISKIFDNQTSVKTFIQKIK